MPDLYHGALCAGADSRRHRASPALPSVNYVDGATSPSRGIDKTLRRSRSDVSLRSARDISSQDAVQNSVLGCTGMAKGMGHYEDKNTDPRGPSLRETGESINREGESVPRAQETYNNTGDDRYVGLVENHLPMQRDRRRQPLLAAEVMSGSLPVHATSTPDEDTMEASVEGMTRRETPAPVKVSWRVSNIRVVHDFWLTGWPQRYRVRMSLSATAVSMTRSRLGS